METNFLSKYLFARFSDELYEPPPDHKGMVVTVSRDTGCDGVPIVEEVVRQLNKDLKGINKKHPWRYVSKEILEKSAKRLNVKPEIFEKWIHAKDRSVVEDIILSFSKESYPSNFKIKKTLKAVIESVANEGAVIILGRAGVALVNHNKRNLHIKLTAPLQWRIEKIAKEYNVSLDKAKKHILYADKQRDDLKHYYMGRKVQFTDFDVMLNTSTLTKKEICSAIISMVDNKSL